jgi:polar amino acid transport system permease protein
VVQTPARWWRDLGRRGALLSTLSTLTFLAVVVAVVLSAPGTSRVADAFFAPHGFSASLPSVASGFLINVEMMLVAETIVLVSALVIAVVRSIPGPVFAPLRVVAIVYTDLFRGVPMIIVIFMVGLGLPGLQLSFVSHQSLFVYGVTALVLVYSAYVAELYRAGIDSVHPSQMAAARSLGLSEWKSMRYVILPQAVRRVIPPLLNDFVALQKDTALISLIGVVEAARAAENYAAQTYNFTGYTVAALLFLVLTIPLARLTDVLIARDRVRTGG